MSALSVSVIIPVFNAEKWLRECLDSVLAQTLRDIEIIAVNDGSTDKSSSILREYAARDARMRIVDQENKGAGEARNTGMDAASAPYTIFLDADDVFYPEMLSRLHKRIVETDADIVVCRYDRFQAEDPDSIQSVPNSIRDEYLPKTDVFSIKDFQKHAFQLFHGAAWNKLFRTAFIKGTGYRYQSLRNSNDTYFVFMNLLEARRIAIVPDALLKYRICEGSLARIKEDDPLCFIEALRACHRTMVEKGTYHGLEQSFINRVVSNIGWNFGKISEKMKKQILPDVLQFCEEIHLFDIDVSSLNKWEYVKIYINLKVQWKFHKNLKEQVLKNGNIKISVIIAAYNCESFINQCIDSLLDQTFKQFEIICVDDGSTDNTLHILKKYELNYNFIHVYSQKNQYAGVARNNGMSHAKGDYLLFLDSDDFFHQEMLETIYKKAVMVDAEIVVFNGQEYDMIEDIFKPCKFPLSSELFPKKEVCSAEDFGEKLFQANSCLAWNKLIKFDFIKKIGVKFGNTKSSNDTVFIYTLLALAKRITLVNKVFINYRTNNPNSLQRSKSSSWESICLSFFALKKELILHNVYDFQKKTFINKALRACMYYLNTIDQDTRILMECSLMNKYFKLLDLNNINQEYIYIKSFYNQYKAIKDNTYIPIVYATNENYAKYMTISMISIMENNKTKCKLLFFIFVDEQFSDNIRQKIKNIVNKYDSFVRFIEMPHDFDNVPMYVKHISFQSCYRLLIPKVLSYLDKLIYIDCDTIINSDITELYNINMKDNYLAGVNAYAFNNKKHSTRLGINTDYYINSGVLLINNRLLIKDKKIKTFYELIQKKYACQDQDILNVACAGRIMNISLKYNFMTKYVNQFEKLIKENKISINEFNEASTSPVIIHYADKIKPWDDRKAPFSTYFYKYAQKLNIDIP